MIQDLVELLDRQWRFLESQEHFEFVAQLFPFFDSLGRDPGIAAILVDSTRDEDRSRETLARAEHAAVAGLLQVFERLAVSHPGAFPTKGEADDNLDWRIPTIRARLVGCSDPA